jgi:glycosyltransferase involved in cell wall biosynthesis
MMPLLTIGMPCYNDYSGAWFTVQALRMQIQERTEILVVDTFGDDRLKKFVEQDCRCSYVRAIEPQGTAPAKNHVFAHANGKFVLCLDSHVLLLPGSITALVNYLDKHPEFDGLGYGPLIYDNLRDAVCAMKPVWRGHMWGIWGDYQQIETLPSEPLEIWGHGGGCFVAKKDSWLGFNSQFRGFGGEEGYLPEKYRKHGKKVLCFPWLRWAHRFGPATGYRLDIDDRIRNYLIGMEELALDTKPVYDHFGEAATSKVAENLKEITVKSFNGIGDLLYATPSFEAIKKRHPLRRIVVNTNHRWLLEGNPHVDAIGSDDSGVFLGYPDVIHCQRPVQHHILTDWEIICKQYNLVTDKPQLRPRIHFEMPPRRGGVLVQVIDKGSWHGKKTWPHAQKFSDTYGFAAIPKFEDQKDLVRCIATAQLVVCMEGGIHHIAAANF